MVAFTSALSGMAQAEAQLDQTASQIARLPASASAPAQDSVDLSSLAVSLLQARNNFDANTKLIKIADQMDQTLFNMVG